MACRRADDAPNLWLWQGHLPGTVHEMDDSLCGMAQADVAAVVQDMETLVCRQTLAGHKHDVLCISGLQLCPVPRTDSSAAMNRGVPAHADDTLQVKLSLLAILGIGYARLPE